MAYPAKVDATAILDCAVRSVEEGADEISMRSLAEQLGLTVSSLYRYYPDRAALEAAVAGRAAQMLDQRLRRAERSAEPLLDALRAYRRFAAKHPGLYARLFGARPYDATPGSPFRLLWQTFLRLVATATGDPDDTDMAVAIWSFVHGFLMLERSGQFGPSGPKAAFERGIAALLKGSRR